MLGKMSSKYVLTASIKSPVFVPSTGGELAKLQIWTISTEELTVLREYSLPTDTKMETGWRESAWYVALIISMSGHNNMVCLLVKATV